MTNTVDVYRNLDHCMRNIAGASEAMGSDMHHAAMQLGAAEMMLASASNAVRGQAARLTNVPAQADTGDSLGG